MFDFLKLIWFEIFSFIYVQTGRPFTRNSPVNSLFFFKTRDWEEICFLNWHFKNVREHYCFFLRPYADDTMKLLCFPCTQLLRELFPLLSFQNLGFIRIFFVLLYADDNRCFCVFLLLYVYSECPKTWFYFIYILYVILMPCASGWFILSFIYFSTFSHCGCLKS